MRKEIEDTFCHSGELSRVLYALSTSEGNRKISHLEEIVDKKFEFNRIAKDLLDSTENEEINRRYREDMRQIWDEKNFKVLESSGDESELRILGSASIQVYVHAIRLLDKSTYRHLRSVSSRFGVSQSTMILASTGFDIAVHMKRYWCGETTGRQAVSDVMRSLVREIASVGGGIAGAYVGATLGTMSPLPFGGIVGGLVGSFVGSYTAQKITDPVFSFFYNLFYYSDQQEALKIAYEFMGLSAEDASNDDINHRYRYLARVYHPDKNKGNDQKFITLQASTELIRQSRKGL